MVTNDIDREPLQALRDVVREIRDRAIVLDEQLGALERRIQEESGELAAELVDDVMRWADAFEAGALMLDQMALAGEKAADALAEGLAPDIARAVAAGWRAFRRHRDLPAE